MSADRAIWGRSSLHALTVSAFVLGLFSYWFGIADRYAIFLYGHLGAGPFDSRTVSRYWMTGLVASGAVTVLYAIANWFAGRIAGLCWRRYVPPPWWQVWVLSLPWLIAGIPGITMTLNSPTLPFSLAVRCAAVAIIGLALALMPGKTAAQQPGELLWLAAAGLALSPSLLLLRAFEGANVYLPATRAYGIALGSNLIGGAVACGIGYGYRILRRNVWKTGHLIVGALIWSYLLAPLVHHLFLTPPRYRYISVADNFFASTPTVQALCFLALGVQAWLVVRVQQKKCTGSGYMPSANG